MAIFALGIIGVFTENQSAEVSITVLQEEPGTPITCWANPGTNYPEITTICEVKNDG